MNSTFDLEKLLYKLVFQFIVFSHGINKQLEPYLLKINKKLKKGCDYQLLNDDLIELSSALGRITQTQQITDFKANDLTHQRYFIEKLISLLVEINIPAKFQSKFNRLKRKIESGLDQDTYKATIDEALELLVNIRDHAATEQKEIELFLADMPKQLSLLESQAKTVVEANSQAIESRGKFNNDFGIQVDQIKNTTAQANELSSLQKNINLYLQDLTSQLQKHKEIEDSRQIETQKKLNLMSQKLQDMEVEADSLRNNLKVAHDKALRDPLTGLPNRLAYDERIKLEYNRWKRYQLPLSVVIWDIDLFKLINDNYGHKAGDKTLTLVAQLILNNCRKSDFTARFGGEEFVMLLPNTSSDQTLVLTNNIREIIARSGFNHNGKSIKLTISCGISQFLEGDEYDEALERADQALYSSKKRGRNQCTVFGQ